MKKRAFTLIELLTVMAISAILLTIIVYPLIKSFDMTRAAQSFSEAQDRARIISERVAREIGNATSVRSLSGVVATRLNQSPNTGVGAATDRVPQHSLVVQVPGQDGTIVDVLLPFAKLDLVPPAEGEPTAGGFRDPNTGMVDPTLIAPKGQVVLPVAPGTKIRRYFIGLRNPFQNYNNPYDGILMARNANQDNLYVLYVADVTPILPGGGVDTRYFAVDPITGGPEMDDPRFFVPNRDNAGNIITNDEKAERIRNWLGDGAANTLIPVNIIRRAVIQTELSRYDMIQTVYDTASRVPEFNGNIPRIVPLIQFRPGRVDNETAEGQIALRQGEESDSSARIAPDVYKTQYGLWERPIIRNWAAGWDPTNTNANQYSVLRGDPSVLLPGGISGTSIFVFDPDVNTIDTESGTEVFDVTVYQRTLANGGLFPFSVAVAAADTRSGWLSSNLLRNSFVPYVADARSGKVITSFGIGEVGDYTSANPPTPNLPLAVTSTVGPFTPTNDPDTAGNFYDAAHEPINEKFNKVWADNPWLQPNVHRFLDLRVTANADGTMGPLNPTTGFARASIVPGTDEVYGPDQVIGPHYGQPIRYTRTTQEPGPNQYRLNYTDLREPTNPSTGVVDYTVAFPDLTPAQISGFDPNTYDPQNFISAVLQPRFKKGYIKFCSDPTLPLPVGQIRVAYRFQFNAAGNTSGGYAQDVFAVDYDTRQLINVLLTIRNYPQSTSVVNPQTVTLKSTAAVRNTIR